VHGATATGGITRVLAEHGHYLEELVRVTPDLESAFLAITEDQPHTRPGTPGAPA